MRYLGQLLWWDFNINDLFVNTLIQIDSAGKPRYATVFSTCLLVTTRSVFAMMSEHAH